MKGWPLRPQLFVCDVCIGCLRTGAWYYDTCGCGEEWAPMGALGTGKAWEAEAGGGGPGEGPFLGKTFRCV